jgi:hypothetical protein
VLTRLDAIQQHAGLVFFYDCFSVDPRVEHKPMLEAEICLPRGCSGSAPRCRAPCAHEPGPLVFCVPWASRSARRSWHGHSGGRSSAPGWDRWVHPSSPPPAGHADRRPGETPPAVPRGLDRLWLACCMLWNAL